MRIEGLIWLLWCALDGDFKTKREYGNVIRKFIIHREEMERDRETKKDNLKRFKFMIRI